MLTEAVAQSDVGTIPESVRVGDAWLPTWPEGNQLRVLGGASVAMTRFADIDLYHGPLVASVLAAREDPRFRDPDPAPFRWGCGFKVRHVQAWNAAAASLVHMRALALAHRVMGLGPAHCDESWGSIYANGDYCMAHSHTRADVSIVYMADAGDGDPADNAAGKLMFLDPRVDYCCPIEPGRATRPLIPEMTPGSMVAFAGECVHLVNPYHGTRPRITLSWNMTRTRLAEEGRRRPA
jgi:hypothetical protein